MRILHLFLFSVIAFSSLFILSCDREVSTSPPDAPVSTGFISIKSDPPGAAIYINGKNTGKLTPDSIRWLKDDLYKVTLKMKLYRDTAFFAKAEQNKRNEMDIDYYGNPLMLGSIYCAAKPPKSLIILNSIVTGKYTPYTFNNLKPGVYSVAYQAFGCRTDSQHVTVESSKTSYSFIELTDTTVWLNYNKSNSPLPDDMINCIAVDASNVVWIGTGGSGLVSFDGLNWKTYTPANSPIPGYGVTCLAVENTTTGRNIWVGTYDGLARFDGLNWTVYKTSNSKLPDNYINTIAKDYSLNIWVGTNKGIAKIPRGGVWTVYNTANSKLPDNIVTKIAFDMNTAWIGTNDSGLVKFANNTWTTLRKMASVSALWAGLGSGSVWAGHFLKLDAGGVYVNENGESYSVSGMPGTKPECIVQNEMYKWIGTVSGLVKVSNKSVQFIFHKGNSGLPDNHIMDIAFDSEGKMWIATFSGGIVKYKIQ